MEMRSHLKRVERLLGVLAVAVEVVAQEHFDKEAERRRKLYLLFLLALYLDYLNDQDAARFVRRLRIANTTGLRQFVELGYRRAKGMHTDPPNTWLNAASTFVNSFAGNFLRDLRDGTGVMDYRRRTLMYGEEGFRIAYFNGLQAAMAERGATHWQRVLHPESSITGPCILCIEDAQVIHPISEPFLSLHPNDVCTLNPIGIRFSGAASFEMGIPGLTENEITRLLREGGIEPETIVRRPPTS